MKNYYDDLGIGKGATPEQIRKEYRALAKKYHPDSRTGDAEKFKRISEAYSVLSDPKKKSEYDDQLSYGQAETKRREETRRRTETQRREKTWEREEAPEEEEYFDPFASFFFHFGGQRERSGFRSGNHFSWTGQRQKPRESGGTQNNRETQRSRETKRSRSTGRTGRSAGRTKSSGAAKDRDIHATVKVSASEAVKGCRKKVSIRYKDIGNGNAYKHYMVSRSFLVDVPSGVRNGTKIRLKGAGKPPEEGGTGNVIVTVAII